MYPAQVKKLLAIQGSIDDVVAWLQDKVDNAGDSDAAQEKASTIEDIVNSLEEAKETLDTATQELEGLA